MRGNTAGASSPYFVPQETPKNWQTRLPPPKSTPPPANAEENGVPYGSRTRVAAVKEKGPIVIQCNFAAWIALYRTSRTHGNAYWTLKGRADQRTVWRFQVSSSRIRRPERLLFHAAASYSLPRLE